MKTTSQLYAFELSLVFRENKLAGDDENNVIEIFLIRQKIQQRIARS